ncbi:MAG TPA: hypothetical protein VIY51_20680 [Xanthobacteraceae bacterium]
MNRLFTMALVAQTFALSTAAVSQETRYDNLANQPFTKGFLSKDAIAALPPLRRASTYQETV